MKVKLKSEGLPDVDFMLRVFFDFIGLCIGMVWSVFVYLIKGFWFLITNGMEGKSEEALQCNDSAATPKLEEKPSANVSRDLGDLYSKGQESKYLDSTVQTISVRGASIRMWFYPNQGIVKRTVRMTSKATEQRVGAKRLQLADLEVTFPRGLAAAVDQTKAEVNEILKVLPGEGEKTRKSVPKPLPAVKQEPAILPQTPPTASDPVSTFSEPECSSPPSKSEAREPRVKEAVFRGELLSYGYSSCGDGPEKYRVYCLDLLEESVGSKHQVRGMDLERAIKDAKVKVGDRIEVAQVGSVKTAKKRNMNLFSIQKLKPA